jgi:hypothetical protein
MLDTASQRPATGMDMAARKLILKALEGSSRLAVLNGFMRDRYPDFTDYTTAVRTVWGDGPADKIATALSKVANEQPPFFVANEQRQAEQLAANAVLLQMPEPDFRVAVFDGFSQNPRAIAPVERINKICKQRGIPWAFTSDDGFTWTGDAEAERTALRPALSAVDDPRFLGVKNHFDAARSEVAIGTPIALRQSVHESACAVESAMKVLLTQRGAPYGENDTAFKLFESLVTSKLVPQFMQFSVLATASPRNKRGGHGPAEMPHDVPQEMAEAVLASAAVSIAYLYKLLP